MKLRFWRMQDIIFIFLLLIVFSESILFQMGNKCNGFIKMMA